MTQFRLPKCDNSAQLKVSRTPVETGVSGWQAIANTHRFDLPALDQDIETPWLIIGAGFAGIAAAQRLSQLVPEHERIVLVDACKLAQGPAGRNSGYMIDLPHDLNSHSYTGASDEDLKQINLNRSAIDFAQEMAEQYKMPSQVFNRNGKVSAAAGGRGVKQLENYSLHLKQLNERFCILDRAQMTSYTGTSYYQQGLFTPGAATIQPAAFIQLAAKGLSDRVEIYQQTPVTGIIKGGAQNFHQVSAAKKTIKAKKIILAVNGHIESFGYFKRRLLHIFTYASMSEALTSAQLSKLDSDADWGVLPADPMGTTVRKISDYQGSGDRIVVRNHFTYNPNLETTLKEIHRIKKKHDRAFRARFEMLEDVNMQYRWGGRLCLSLNSVPAFGEVDDNIFSAACQNGLGTVKGTLAGMLAAELAVQGKTQQTENYLSYQQPQKLPPQPFLSLGVKANLVYKEWLSGREL